MLDLLSETLIPAAALARSRCHGHLSRSVHEGSLMYLCVYVCVSVQLPGGGRAQAPNEARVAGQNAPLRQCTCVDVQFSRHLHCWDHSPELCTAFPQTSWVNVGLKKDVCIDTCLQVRQHRPYAGTHSGCAKPNVRVTVELDASTKSAKCLRGSAVRPAAYDACTRLSKHI